MKQHEAIELKTDANGNIDLDYYIETAYRTRGEMIMGFFYNAYDGLMARLEKLINLVFGFERSVTNH